MQVNAGSMLYVCMYVYAVAQSSAWCMPLALCHCTHHTNDISPNIMSYVLILHFMQNLWEYVEGMLTNLGSMPLEKLHSMLLMFAVSDESAGDVSVDDLKRLMEAKIIAGKVTYSSGLYSLPD